MTERLIRLARRHAFDAAIVALAAGVLADAWIVLEADALFVAVAGLAVVPLLLRRRFPLGAPLAAMLLLAVVVSIDGRVAYDSGTLFFTAVFASWAVGNGPDQRKAFVGLLAVVCLSFYVNARFPDVALADYFWVPIVLSAVWLSGFVLSRRSHEAREAAARAAHLAAEREEEAARAIAEERARIARELHDVVAHGVSVMTVQAAGVRRLLRDDQEREREALLTVERTGRQALADMRRMLGVLRDANEQAELAPQPGLEALDRLAHDVREAGLPVELRVEGEPYEVPAGIDLSAYRIVQEALTNALRHAGPARATVLVRYEPGALELEIANDGAGGGEQSADGGRGLVGMRERVAFHGGTVETGPGPDGAGFVVRARIPVAREEAAWPSA